MMDDMQIRDAAIDWLVRQRDPAFDEWEAFGDWLAEDPTRAAIYQELAALDADIGDWFAVAPSPVSAPDPVSGTVRIAPSSLSRRRFGGWLGGAVAASLVAMTGYAVLQSRPDPYSIETAAGERRSVRLADGSSIDLNGATRLILDRRDARVATLDRGEALFTVVHDDDRPFIVHAAGAELRDVGTIFNVVRDGGRLSVAVAEGEVIYNPGAENVSLPAGRTLMVRDGDAVVRRRAADPAAMVAWRQNRLVYDGAPIGDVAADLHRNLGLAITAAPDVAARPFRGAIALERNDDRFLARLGPLLDVTVERGQQGWVLTARDK
ncbi:FecR family protein [Sphingomonas laterariae]|uniref:FecR family protein n=1 Tax=Edaphosphingomonas laterariae TaxID=861865 RepID=A0A239GTL0_9SPHN|nr:FecR domain-containing protein [Sphingomonas laterariae]SNS72470.1 FecR family protein [Sphingomonas laterariae]